VEINMKGLMPIFRKDRFITGLKGAEKPIIAAAYGGIVLR